MNNRVLITGASGFIGSFLVEEALRQRYDVYAGVRKTSSREYLQDDRIHFIELDISSQQALEKQFAELIKGPGGFDYVIHNAGITYAPKKDDFLVVNFEYTKTLVNALRASGMPLKKFVLISSLAAYGPGDPKTFDPIRMSGKQKPVSRYGESKMLAEQHVRSLADFPYLVINPTGVYGPRDKDFLVVMKMINNGFEPNLGWGPQKLSFVFVKDLARAVVLAMTSPVVQKSYLVSDGINYEKQQFGETVRKVLGKRTLKISIPLVPLRWTIKVLEMVYGWFGSQPFLNEEELNEISSPNWLCDSSEIWTVLGTAPQYPMEKGVPETVRWYQEKGWL
jgi:UDP-glucose 4-epimerase